MYIVAIAWLYVTLMMAVTEKTIIAGVLTFFFYGLLPCSVLMWLMGAPSRGRARRKAAEAAPAEAQDTEEALVDEHANQRNGADTKRD